MKGGLLEALGKLDSAWAFVSHHPVLFGLRVWPDGSIDTLIVLGPELVIGRRDKIGRKRATWSSTGTVERMVQEIKALPDPKAGPR